MKKKKFPTDDEIRFAKSIKDLTEGKIEEKEFLEMFHLFFRKNSVWKTWLLGILSLIVSLLAVNLYWSFDSDELPAPVFGYSQVHEIKKELLEKYRKPLCSDEGRPEQCMLGHFQLKEWTNEWKKCQNSEACNNISASRAEMFILGIVDYGMHTVSRESICIPPGKKKIDALELVDDYLNQSSLTESKPAAPMVNYILRQKGRWHCWDGDSNAKILSELMKIEWEK